MLLNGDVSRRNGNVTYSVNRPLVVEVAVLETFRRLRSRKTNNSSIRLCKQARIRVAFFQGSNSKLIPKTRNLLRQFVETFWTRYRSIAGSLPIQGNKHTINADIFMPCVGFEPHELPRTWCSGS